MKFNYVKILVASLFLLMGTGGLSAQKKLEISGKIRVLEPLEIKLEDIEGNVLQKIVVENNKDFRFRPMSIHPDVYWLCFGDTRQLLYLGNREMKIKGFYNSRNVESSSLEFTGLEDYYKIMEWYPQEKNHSKMNVDAAVKGKLEGNMYSALAYLADMTSLEPNRYLLECMSEEARKSLSGKWLQNRIDSLSKYCIGAVAPDFELLGEDGNKVHLSDFRGKLVLLDFCASWCGPCRHELKNLRSIYKELKGDDLVFISISMDAREKDWKRMILTENLPWKLLWNKEGFGIRNEVTGIQQDYGFVSIPFIVLIDEGGHIAASRLRGEKVKEAILKARKECNL